VFKKIKDLINKYSTSINVINNIVDFKIRSNHLLNLALTSSESITVPYDMERTELIISLTTYNKRIHDVHLVIESIAQQTIKPNRLILWLDKDEFTVESIPIILHKQIKRGLEVKFCPDYRSYKKLIPTLQQFPDADVITIDDDVLYPHDMVEALIKEHQRYPQCIIANRENQILFNKNGEIKPYGQWIRGTEDESVLNINVPVGVGGVLYPMGSLHSECLNIEGFMKLAPYADDIWFKAMSLLNNVKCKKVNDSRNFMERYLSIESAQDIALSIGNVVNEENDGQIKSIFEHYKLFNKLVD